MSFKIVRGQECDHKGTFLRYSSSNSVSDCIDHATDFIRDNHLEEWMDCFSLKRGTYGSNIIKHFYWHDCKCGLPRIICQTSPLIKHKYITRNDQKQLDIDLYDFFDWADNYIWKHVLPKEGEVKYPSHLHWPDSHSVDNEPNPQPPEEVITQSGVKDPPEEVLSLSDIEWEEVETSLSYLGDNGESYTVYR